MIIRLASVVFALLILSSAQTAGMPPALAQEGSVSLDLHVDHDVQVGDTFSISGNITNNSPDEIIVHNGCGGPLSVELDGHAQVGVKKVCNWMAVQVILKPGESIDTSSLPSNLVYSAVSAGVANATVSISYEARNQPGANPVTVSKTMTFTVHGMTSGKLPPLKQLRSGIPLQNVTCNNGFQLVFKASDGSPKCLRPSSVDKLVRWGWAKLSADVSVQPQSSIKEITLEDNGKSISMHPGDRFLLNLGSNFNWNVEIDNPSVLSRVVNILVINGAQGVYESHQTGSATLVAAGNPLCRSAPVPCMIHSILFKIDITVD